MTSENDVSQPPSILDTARVEGNFSQLIVKQAQPLEFAYVFNDRWVEPQTIDNLTVVIDPDEGGGLRGTITVVAENPSGPPSQRVYPLFPGTFQVFAFGRLISISAEQEDSLDGVWVSVGMNLDGRSNRLRGLKSLRIVLSGTLLDGQIQWDTGTAEPLFPELTAL